MRSRLKQLLLALLLVTVGSAVVAQDDAVPWNSLSAEEQQLLDPLQDRWADLPADRQNMFANGSRRFIKMDPEQRARAQDRFDQWRQLPPERQQAIRSNWNHYKQLTPDQRRRLRRAGREFRDLPPEKRQELRAKWDRMTPEQRQRVRDRMRQHRTDRRKTD